MFNKNTKGKTNINSNFASYLFSFSFSALLIFLVFLINGMIFGQYTVLRSDYLDTIAAYKDFVRCIYNGESIFYSFNSCMGMNNSMSLALSFFNPFNIFYFIFYKCDYNVVSFFVILLKVSLCSLTFNIFSRNVLKNTSPSSIFFSVFYSLGAYVIQYGTIHIFWLDAVYILPFLLFLIKRLFDTKKRALLVLTYTYLFITNFYMGYMVGVFSLFVVILYITLLYKPKSESVLKEKMSYFFDWFFCAGIAIALSALVWCPTLFFLIANRAEDSSSVITIQNTLLSVINSLFWGMNYEIVGLYGYIYCGIPVFMLIPLYFINKKIRRKELFFSASILIFMLLCTIITPLNSMFHGFDQPDYFWYRYSFIISFIVCSIACREYSFFIEENNKIRKCFIIFILFSLFYIFMQHTSSIWDFSPTYILNDNLGLIVNVLLMLLWILFVYLCFSKHKTRVAIIFAAILMSAELLSNSYRIIVFKNDYSSYKNVYNYMNRVVEEIQSNDTSSYRMICSNVSDLCNDTKYGYYGIGDFGDQERFSLRRFLANIGFASSTRVLLENGYNPVSQMLLGVKYVINCPEYLYNEELENNNDFSEYDVFDKSLSFGYLVNGDVLLYDYAGRNVFENMNDLVKTMTGIEQNCFVEIEEDEVELTEVGLHYDKFENGRIRFNRISSTGSCAIVVKGYEGERVYLQPEVESPSIETNDYSILYAKNICVRGTNDVVTSCSNEMYYDEDAKFHYLSFYSDEECKSELDLDRLNVYYLDEESLSNQYEELKKGELVIDEMTNGYISGRVSVIDDKRLLFTSIPYDPGWKVFINGIETEAIRVLDGNFMAVFLPNIGDYNLVFKYEVPGLKIGIVISLCGLLAFISVLFENKLKKKNNESTK